MREVLGFTPEVEAALAARHPVVALETTLVTHGLPHPQGLEAAAALERIVREHGAVPATCAIMDGRVHVGLTAAALTRLADCETAKVNLGNFAAVIASGRAGSTTVAATMAISHLAGISVLATGGIGGVHRGAVESGDISADLTALARFPVAVVCAGVKALLDLPRTVQAMETAGIPVLGYRTGELPAFYRRKSGLALDARCDSVGQIADCVATHFGLGDHPTGVLVANPIPRRSEMPKGSFDVALARALAALEGEPIQGRQVTPFLLRKLDEFSGGATVRANVALLENNARLAARLAQALHAR